ncbi:type II toxin-antitoxin system VapC family toxin [Caulobacter soli]|uniref:type II toxin-antitoxin system VapC family toxin n=1 Tax=Caulobacter soli TaxID=2708539 RepID=UPI0013EAACF3|nr:type II toxin-antitoxin system VapC family toxin [Caulobacter soli]
MFVDASAFCAILLGESDRNSFEERLAAVDGATTSAVAIWETVRSLARGKGLSMADARVEVEAYLSLAEIRVIAIGEPEAGMAIDAFARFGKGAHPARLNMGDCFAYACAKTNGVPLLYKGDDFVLTDIEPA